MGKAFAAHSPVQENILDNGDAPFGLPAAALQSLEFPRAGPLLELVRAARADAVVNAFGGQAGLVGLAVKAAVSGGRLQAAP